MKEDINISGNILNEDDFMKSILFLFTFLLLASAAFAATDTVMLVTGKTSVDSATAAAAASKAGVPVLVLEDGILTETVKTELASLAPSTVVLVGGPVVIKTEVEAGLKTLGYNVIRLWGVERTGTALAVAKHFWSEGSSCAVLVDDTMSSEVDSRRQRAASNIAANFGCTLVPVPEGSVPADVLATLKDLEVTDVWLVSKEARQDVREILKQFRLKEISGDDDEIDNETGREIVKTAKKIVIVATPDWKAAVAVSAEPNDRSVVRHVASVDELPPIIEFIKSNNISDVRVVGVTNLVIEVAAKLQAEGIAVTRVSGRSAEEISRELVKKERQEWEKKRAEREAEKQGNAAKIKEKLLERLAETEKELDAALAEAQALEQNADTEALIAAINDAKSKIGQIKSRIESGQLEDARRMLAEIGKYREIRFERRERLKIDISSDLTDETEGVKEASDRSGEELSRIENALAAIRQKCANTEIVDAVIEKAKSLREDVRKAREAGDHLGASGLSIQARELADIAKHTAELCRKTGKITEETTKITERRGVMIEKIAERRQNTGSSGNGGTGSGTSSGTSGTQREPATFTVEMSAAGFSPNTLKIRKGDTMKFTTADSGSYRPASAVHPTHTVYPGSGIEKCETDERTKIFDACGGIGKGESFSFVFNERGTWRYHDHNNPTNFGAITVE